MIKRLFIALCATATILLSSAEAQTPEANKDKYEMFRTRLRYEMMYYSGDATVKGSHLPMERRYVSGGKLVGYWADATWWQGHYVAVLATEYYLKKLHGENTAATLDELRQALATYNRLDSEAEACWGCDTFKTLNGFYIRDDMDDSSLPFFPLVDHIHGDYRHCGDVQSTSNTPSQDQAWGTYLGLALTLKLVDDSAICNDARQIARRMVKSMQYTSPKGRTSWQVVNPVTGNVEQIEGDIKWLKYGHAKVGTLLSGEDMNFDRSRNAYWRSMWDVVQNNVFISKTGNFRWYGIMALTTVMNDEGRGSGQCYDWLVKKCYSLADKRPDLKQPILFPHLPLINVVLYGYNGKKADPADVYVQLLNTAPTRGAGTYTLNDSTVRTPAPWHTLSLFCPWHDKSTGDFNMIDYMLLYNLYCIVYQEHLPEYEAFWRVRS